MNEMLYRSKICKKMQTKSNFLRYDVYTTFQRPIQKITSDIVGQVNFS